MILQTINDKLLEIDPNVFYGAVKNSMKETLWNYVVFNRTTKRQNENKTGYTEIYAVHIVRENWLDEGLEEAVIKKVCEIAGMRMIGEGSYTYVMKPNTDTVIEMFSVEFARPIKKV